MPTAARRGAGLLLGLALVAVALSGCGNRGTAGITPVGQRPSGDLAVVANCVGAPSVRPTTIVLSCADGNVLLNELHWRTWTATGALGTGQLSTNDCTPTCAAGTFTQQTVDVTVGTPRAVHDVTYLSELFTTPTGTDQSTAHQLVVPR